MPFYKDTGGPDDDQLVEVQPEIIDAALRAYAATALAWVCADLGLPPSTRVRWSTTLTPALAGLHREVGHQPETMTGNGRQSGRMYHDSPNDLWIKSNDPAYVIQSTVLHEARHAWQQRRPEWARASYGDREADANAYEREARRRMDSPLWR